MQDISLYRRVLLSGGTDQRREFSEIQVRGVLKKGGP